MALFPSDGAVRELFDSGSDGPFCYGFIADRFAHLQFVHLKGVMSALDCGTYIIHDRRRTSPVGHVSGLRVNVGGDVVVYDEAFGAGV